MPVSDSLHSKFERISLAMDRAVIEKSLSLAQAEAEHCGLSEVPPKNGQSHRWEFTDGTLVLALDWRWYDQSKSFSIRPDMNVMVLTISDGDQVIRRIEKRYED